MVRQRFRLSPKRFYSISYKKGRGLNKMPPKQKLYAFACLSPPTLWEAQLEYRGTGDLLKYVLTE